MTEEIYRPYQYSVSLDTTAKGFIQPSIKVLSDSLSNTSVENALSIETTAILLLDSTVKLLRSHGYRVATDIEEIKQNGKD